MRAFKCTLILAFILFSIANVAMSQRPQQRPGMPRSGEGRASAILPEKEEERASLFPGRSVTLLGIIVTWHLTPGDVAVETEEEKGYVRGTVDIVGPKNSMKNLKFQDYMLQDGISLYIDEVYIRISGYKASLDILARKYSQKKNVTAAPQNVEFYVSHLCPVFLNEWKLSVSGEKETFPDGSEYYILTVENPETSERETIPLSEDARRKVGRYDIYIDGVYELTKTVRLRIDADIDESIQGRDAYVERFQQYLDYLAHSTYEEIFNILASRYGFTVEWVEYPGHPESIELIKNERHRTAPRFTQQTVNQIVEYFKEREGLGAEWKTPTHLQLWYKDYDKVLARKEKEEKRKEENKKIEEEFNKDYAAETRAYYFKTISSKTAKSLIDPELDTYFLVKYLSVPYRITKGEVPEGGKLVAKSMEQSVADEKTDALILTAIPKTHEKFEKVLEKIDAVLEKTEKPEAAKPFLLSVTLLQGVRSTRESITSALRVGAALKFGDLRLRVVRVNENNVNDEMDDSVELVVNTSTTSMDVTIEEFRSEFVDDYAISVPEIRPAGKPEEALATITIRYAAPPEAVKPRPETPPTPKPKELEAQQDVTDLAKQFGLSKEDMEFLGVEQLEKVGQGVLHLVPERGKSGTAMVSLSANYSCTLEFQDVREPYLIVRGSLRSKYPDTTLLENTIYLESGKPTLLGITNLREALILLVQLRE